MLIKKYTNKVLSIIFRLTLISFAIIIVLSKQNLFSWGWYIFAIIPYLAVYMISLFREGVFSKIRLLNDFLFITFIAFQKDIDLVVIIFLTLPVINSPNYSGEKKSLLLYFFYLISLFVVNDFIWSWSFLTITFFLLIINGISRLRQQFFTNISKLNDQIDCYLEQDLDVNKSYKIYDGLIKSLNSIDLMIGFSPEVSQIVCFRIINGRLVLENSSDFIWSHTIDRNLVRNVRRKSSERTSENVAMKLNGDQKDNNFVIYNKSKSQEYVYIFISEKPFTNKLGVLYLRKILNSVTNRISRVIAAEIDIKTNKKVMLDDFRKKYFQIQNSEKAMHFIRNRFNTLDNFIEMSKDNLAGNMDSEDLKLYQIELDRLERNFIVLMERVKSILDKTDKPFSAANLEKKSVNYIFNLVREIWSDYFPDFNVIVKVDFKKTEKQIIKINTDGFYILISDWISNLKKYSKSDERVIFDESEDAFIIIFENKFLPESKIEIESLKNDFNSTERDKILKRTSHGVLIMKSILEEMNVLGTIEVEECVLKLKLIIKKQVDENSSF